MSKEMIEKFCKNCPRPDCNEVIINLVEEIEEQERARIFIIAYDIMDKNGMVNIAKLDRKISKMSVNIH